MSLLGGKPTSASARHVLTLLTGTGLAQLIALAAAPLLSRLYTPEDFGVFALYLSVVSLLAILATGRYELAIVLPEDDDDARHLLALALLISLVVSAASLGLVLLFGLPLLNYLAPAFMAQRVGGFTLTWLILGVLFFPYVWIIARLFITRSMALETDEVRVAAEGNKRQS